MLLTITALRRMAEEKECLYEMPVKHFILPPHDDEFML